VHEFGAPQGVVGALPLQVAMGNTTEFSVN
jgi:hypothetical protein